LLSAPIVLTLAAYLVVIGFSGPHDFWSNLAMDGCLDAGGHYDHATQACVHDP